MAHDEQPWRNPLHPSYSKPADGRCLGCHKLCCKSAWGYWCFDCNVKRMERIDAQFAKVARALGE